MSNREIYDRCNQCAYFEKEPNLVRYYGHSKYDCKTNPEHKARPNRKACHLFVNKNKAKQGDYCEHYGVEITETLDHRIEPCAGCIIRCRFAGDKTEKDYIRHEP